MTAEKAVRQARSIAEAAVMRASRLAAAAGMDYSTPPGIQVDLSGIHKVPDLANSTMTH
jgi:hypothetical protein